jgi:hypothetical protein
MKQFFFPVYKLTKKRYLIIIIILMCIFELVNGYVTWKNKLITIIIKIWLNDLKSMVWMKQSV